MTDQRCSNLWIINADGTDHRPLTTGNYKDSSPRWSPDGTQLLYVSNRDGAAQIYRRWLDTGQTAKITNLTSAPSGIAWSPDGKWIAFEQALDGPTHMWLREAAGGKERELTGGNCNSFEPAWELDSASFIFASDCGRGIGMPALYRAKIAKQ